VWHRHRNSARELRKQIYAYAKGHVAYQLTTLVRDRDWRAVTRLFLELPRVYWWRIRSRLRGDSPYPLSLVALEVAGTVAAPLAWWRARRRVRRLGRSVPYVPVHARRVGRERVAFIVQREGDPDVVPVEGAGVETAAAESAVAPMA
jgi:hypothetical protein